MSTCGALLPGCDRRALGPSCWPPCDSRARRRTPRELDQASTDESAVRVRPPRPARSRPGRRVPEGGLERRPLGATGLTVSALGMGCAKLGAFWQGRSPAEGRRAIDAARQAGINLFDTADCYARGISERMLGRALRADSGDVVVCTKVGLLKTPPALLSARRSGARGNEAGLGGLARGGSGAGCYAPRYVTVRPRAQPAPARPRPRRAAPAPRPAARGILERQEFLPAVEALVRAGKVAHFGVSCATPDEADAALEVRASPASRSPTAPRGVRCWSMWGHEPQSRAWESWPRARSTTRACWVRTRPRRGTAAVCARGARGELGARGHEPGRAREGERGGRPGPVAAREA